MIAPAGHHCNVRSGHLNATFGGKDMGSMAQTGLLLVPSDALGHTWALPGVLGAGQGLPPESGPGNLNEWVCAGSAGRPSSRQASRGGQIVIVRTCPGVQIQVKWALALLADSIERHERSD